MHIKFLARGTGSARAAADYLLGARDATGQLREGVEVLRGDPHQVAAVVHRERDGGAHVHVLAARCDPRAPRWP